MKIYRYHEENNVFCLNTSLKCKFFFIKSAKLTILSKSSEIGLCDHFKELWLIVPESMFTVMTDGGK